MKNTHGFLITRTINMRHKPWSRIKTPQPTCFYKPLLLQTIYLTQTQREPVPMNFGRFYEVWLQHFHALLAQLATSPILKSNEEQTNLLQLINKVMTHYDDYYRVKAHSARSDVFNVFDAAWLTPLERSLHWIAGWRPTTIFQLVYTELSARFEANLSNVLQGRVTGDLGDLSPSQLARVSELQCETVTKENEITTELGTWQESACDIVGLLVDHEPEIEPLVQVLQKADDLRLKTIRSVVEILTPQQAVEFLTAAAELQFGVRRWGLIKDQCRKNS